MHCLLGLLCGVYYALLASSSTHIVGVGGWFPGAREPRLLARYLLWTIAVPAQWLVFARLFTLASQWDLIGVVIPTAGTMILGLVASATGADADVEDGAAEGVEDVAAPGGTPASYSFPPHQRFRVCFCLSCLCFLTMAKRVLGLPVEPAFRAARAKSLCVQGCIFASYLTHPSKAQLLGPGPNELCPGHK